MRKAKKFILNAVILTITSFLLRSINIGFNVYVSNKIGAEGVGLYQLIMSVYMFAITLAVSGGGLTVTRLVAEELAVGSPAGALKAVKRCLFYILTFSLLAGGVLSFFADYLCEIWFHGKVSVTLIYILAVTLPFIGVSGVVGGYFTAVRRVAKSASAQILETFIRITVSVILLTLFAPSGLEYACFALIAGGAVSEILSALYLFILYLWDKKRYKNGGTVDKSLTKRMLRISVPVAVSSYIRSALNTYKQIIIPMGLEKSGAACDTAIAQYGLIRGMVMPVLMFPSALLGALGSLLVPEIAESYIQKKNTRISYIISKIFKITLLFAICVCGILFTYGDELSRAIYNSDNAGIYIRIFAPLIIIMYFDDIVDAILKGIDEQVHVVGVNIFDTIISIALLYALLPVYGIWGYVAVIFVSEIVNGSLSIFCLIRKTKFRIKIFKWLIVPVISVVVSILITRFFSFNNLVFDIVLVAVLYVLILIITKSITKEDIKI